MMESSRVGEYFEENFSSYRLHIDAGQNSEAVDEAITFLKVRHDADPAQYERDHKGSPFYVLGYAAFASHDYTSASLYFDAAVAADLNYHPGNLDTAALQFLQLSSPQGEPLLATGIIGSIAAAMEALLDDYRTRPDALPLSLADLRTRFFRRIIASPDSYRRTLVTALISFVAEWPYRAQQIELVTSGSREPFFLHLLRGCVLFESLLKAIAGTPQTTLGPVIKHHQAALNLGITKIDTGSPDFDLVVQAVTPGSGMRDTITVTAKTRNTLGHNMAWHVPSLTPASYGLLVKNVAASCLHAIAVLYP